MGNCGSSSNTETQAPAGPIMVLSHYRLSPKGGGKVVHAGLQVLSTRHCGNTGVERKEHYVHNLSHATALNSLYVVMLVCVTCTQLDVYMLPYMSSCISVDARDTRGVHQSREVHEMGLTWFDSSGSIRESGEEVERLNSCSWCLLTKTHIIHIHRDAFLWCMQQ